MGQVDRSWDAQDLRTLIGLSTLGGLAAAATSLRNGIVLTPDGWAYWEGSVSLLEGKGYVYFGGQTIKDWPPLFSWILAGAQAAFGISGLTLMGIQVVVCTLGTVVWTLALVSLSEKARPTLPAAACLVLWIGAFLGSLGAQLLSEPLFLAFLGIMILLRPRAPGRNTPLLIAWSLLLALMLLTRNAALAILPATVVLGWRAQNSAFGTRFMRCAALVLTPVALWWVVRAMLGQSASHRMVLDLSSRELSRRLIEMANSVAVDMGPARSAWRWVALGVIVAVLATILFT